MLESIFMILACLCMTLEHFQIKKLKNENKLLWKCMNILNEQIDFLLSTTEEERNDLGEAFGEFIKEKYEEKKGGEK